MGFTHNRASCRLVQRRDTADLMARRAGAKLGVSRRSARNLRTGAGQLLESVGGPLLTGQFHRR